MPTSSRRRALGSYYTPDWIARWMIAQAMADRDRSGHANHGRILDPACGDGGFLLPLVEWIAARRSVSQHDCGQRLQIVRDHAFGVDADRAAIEALRQRIVAWIGSDSPEVAQVLSHHFHWSDALLGEDWVPRSTDATTTIATARGASSNDSSRNDLHPPPLQWATAFPQVAAEGGFDLVIGNPPYRRELNAKSDFDRIAESTLGQRWRTARMDLWHYFLHRGLDLLKPDGRLSFIVNSYWTSSTAARDLRRRLADETSMEHLVLLGSARLFPAVSGRHLIFQVRNRVDPQARCQVRDLSDLNRSQIEAAFTQEPTAPTEATVAQADLWSSGQLQGIAKVRRAPISTGPVLGDLFEVRQGIAENPPFVTRAAAAELHDPTLAGRGVFVLTDQEVAELELSPHEQSLLRPYYALPAIGRFYVAPQPTHRLLYLTRQTAPELNLLPRIAVHLQRFRSILQRRREVQSGQIAWWHLHWPREERLFISPRILCHQMGHEPRFAYAEHPTFVGFSLHVIVARTHSPAPVSLGALAAILNSRRAKGWFEGVAKRRGAHLDISGAVLKQFPLPVLNQSQTLLLRQSLECAGQKLEERSEGSPGVSAKPSNPGHPTLKTSADDALVALDSIARNWANFADESQLNSLVDQIYGG